MEEVETRDGSPMVPQTANVNDSCKAKAIGQYHALASWRAYILASIPENSIQTQRRGACKV